jgi:N-acetylglucosaminyldiphosphoundecaprenol N-acetyl-beta-D-mannosaminyltransferase
LPDVRTIEPGEPVDVFDWTIEPTRMGDVVRTLRRPSDQPRLVMTVNVALMWMAARDDRLGRIVQDSAIRVADGMGVIWAWRALGRRLPERIAGIDLMVELIAAAAADGRSIYLLGAQQAVIDRLEVVLLERYPDLQIAGSRNGYFGAGDHEDVVADVKGSGADLVFIGMPSPFKEVFAADHLDDFGADLVMGVGGSFDVIAGFVPRAPSLLQRTGLEWAWRLACEPRRMWRRYAVTNAWVARQVVARTIRRRRGTR